MAITVASAHAQNFTIVVLPDTQYYAQDYPATMTAQTQWIVNNISSLNIKAVVGLGDVVNGGGVGSEWAAADNSIDLLEGKVPYFVTIGNHDYNKNDPPNRTSSATNFNNHFGPSRYNHSYSGYGGSYTAGSNENWWGSVTINGKQYVFIQLEFYPRMSVLQWAAGVIRSNPSAEVIITTHGYEYNDDNRVALCNQYNAEYYNMGADNDGDEMWVNLASQFPNVSLVLSGHIIKGSSPSAGHQTEPGFNGNIVNEVMADYQNLTNGGNGYLRIMTFEPGNNDIVVKTYSPTLDSYLTDSANQFTIPWHQTSNSGSGTISGRLKSSACSAISGAKISYSGGSTTTDSNGKFTLSSVPSGIQTVTVQAAGYPTITKQVPAAPGRTANPLFFVSTSTGTVSGTLTDVKTGRAIAGATISSSGSSTKTDSSGKYTLTGVAAVSAQLTASASGYANLTQQISVTSGATSALDFALTPTSTPTTGTVTGKITNSATGAAISGATVLYSGGSGISDSNGNYTLSGVPVGTVNVTASASGMQSSTASVTVTGGNTTTKNFALSPIPTGSVSGTVIDGYTNQPIGAATVSFNGGNTATDANGRYTLNGIPTGTQTITAAAAGYLNQSKSVSISQNSTATANFTLQGSAVGTLSGTVTDALSGAPILGASLTYRGGNTLTNATGSYFLANAPSGTATLSASAGGYYSQNLSATVITSQTTTQNVQLVAVPTYGTITGFVTDATTHANLIGATVSAGGVTASTGGNGSYTLANVRTGSQTLIVDLSGYQEASQAVSVSANATTTANVALTANTGTIKGTITDSASNAPLSGATVSYSGGSTTTNSSGQYTLTAVAPGSVNLTVTLAAYNTSTASATVVAGTSTTKNFTLTLTPTTGTIIGTVSDGLTSLGLPGVTISYSGGSTTTDSNGKYSLANVPAGAQSITATLTLYQLGTQTVTVSAGQTSTANFALVLMPTTGTVTGVVSDSSTSLPISGATVTSGGTNVTTDATGTYTFTNVPAGTQSFSATAANHSAGTQSVSVIAGSSVTQNFSLDPVQSNGPAGSGAVSGTVIDAQTNAPLSGVTITTPSGSATTDSTGTYSISGVNTGIVSITASISGYAVFSATVAIAQNSTTTENFALTTLTNTGGVTGVITDSASNSPLANVAVTYSGGSAVTDANGAFTLANIPAGTQNLLASLSGYSNGSSTVTVIAQQTVTRNFALAQVPTTGSISGVVTDSATNAPLGSATVSYAGGSATTASDGSYTLSSVPSGSQALTASLTGYSNLAANVTVIAGQNATQNFALALVPTTGAVSGHVTDSVTNNPLAGATVSYSGGSTTTDANGAYTLSNLTPGPQPLTVTVLGYNNGSGSATIVAGSTVTQDFALVALPTTGTATGTVTDSTTHAALAGATVSLGSLTANTDATGTYTLNNAPTGSQSLAATLSGYNSSTISAVISAGQTTTTNFTLAAIPTTGTITGKVTDTATSTAIAGATVSYTGGSATTDSTGTFTLSNVPAGVIALNLNATGYSSTSTSVSVAAGSTTTQNFTLSLIPQVGSISGMVTSSSGSALSGVTVAYSGGSAVTNANGNYTLTNVPSGAQTVTASLAGYTSVSHSATITTNQTTTQNFTLSPSTGAITGTITNASTGAALSGTTVSWSGGSATSSSTGTYTLSNVTKGTRSITIKLAGYATVTKSIVVSGGQTATLNIALSATVGSISGTITRASNRAALSGATVSYSGGSTTTNSSGAYTLSNVPTGSRSITVKLAGYATATKSITVTNGVTATLNFALSATTGTITGEITSASTGAALSGASINVAGQTLTSNSSGVYTVTGVLTGTYTMSVKLSGWTTQTPSVSVVGGTTVTKNVPLATTGVVTGTVKTAAGSLDAGVTVTIKGGVIATTTTVTTNSSGVYKTGWVPVGTYTVTVSQSGHTTKTGSAAVSAGKTTTLNFTGF